MRRGKDIVAEFPGLVLIHHNLPGSKIERHSHEGHEIFIPLGGELHFDLGDHAVVAGPGKMIYFPPGREHGFSSSPSQGERLIVLVSEKVWKRGGCGTYTERVLPVSQLCKELLFYLLLHPDTKNHKSIGDTLVKTLDEALGSGATADIETLEHLESKVHDPRLKSALAYLQESLGEAVSLPVVAKRAGLSSRSMSRIFLSEIGLTPKQVLSTMRILRAKELLLSGSSVTEVAMEVGYGSLSSFIRNFRELTGRLPSEVARFGQKR